MRKLITHLIKSLPLLALLLSITMVNAQRLYGPQILQDFETTIRNITPSTTNLGRFDFDVYVLDTDPSQDLVLAGHQLGLYVNPGIFPEGAEISVAIVNVNLYSTLLPAQRPNAIEYEAATNLIKVAGRVPPGPGFPTGPDTYQPAGTIIEKTGNGTWICRIRVNSSLPLVANSQGNFEFMASSVIVPLYPSRVAHYDYTNAVIVLDPITEEYTWAVPPLNVQLDVIPGEVGEAGTNAHVYENPVFNPSTAPTAFNVTGGGSYCEGAGGLPVGLDESELDVNYELLLNGASLVPAVIIPGTGEALSFGNQLAGTYTVVGTSSGGSTDMTGSAVITEDPLIYSTVTLSASATEVCAGTEVTFTADPENGGDEPFYTWYVNGEVVPSEITATYTYAPLNNDEVYVILTPDTFCSAGDATSDVITMVVNPVLPVSVSLVADQTEVCAGTNVTFTATPENGGNAEYAWYVDGEVVPGVNVATYTFAPDLDAEVYVMLTSDLECVSNNPATSNVVSIVVNPLLTPSVTITANPAGAVTTGTEVTFTAIPVNGGDAPTYQWVVNVLPVGTTDTYSYIPVDGDNVYVQLTSNAPCASPETVESNHIIMVVEDEILAPVAFNVTGGGSYCAGEAGVVVGLDGSENGVNYTLFKDGAIHANLDGTGAALNFGNQLAGVYTVSGTNTAGTTEMNGVADVVETPLTTPTFGVFGPYCQFSNPEPLPANSLNQISGTWEPAFISTNVAGSFDFIFTPDAGQCASPATLTVLVNALPGDAGIITGLATVEEGTMNVAYSVAAIADADTYVWTYSGTSVTINGSGMAVTLDFAIGATSGTLSVYGENECGVGEASEMEITVEEVVIPCPDFSTWNGSVSNDWFDADNWTPVVVPCITTIVTIPGGCPAYPTLMTAASIAGLTINDGGSLIGQQFLTVSSDAVVERTISNSFFHLIGSPVDDVTFGDVFLPAYWFEVWAREYNEASGDWENRFIADHLAVGLGYSVQMTTAPQTATFTGALNDMDITRTLANTNPGGDVDRVGWNLLGNPFPSAIDWDAFSTGDYDAQVAVWDEAVAGNYIYWNGTVGSLADGIIPTQNGFFVKTATDGASITIPMAAQVHSPMALYKDAVANALELRATGNNYYDATYVHFNDYATAAFDSNYDAFKLEGLETAPQLYSIADYKLSINELPFEGNEIVKVGFTCGVAGTYSVTASGMESFSGSTPILLEDLKLNTLQDLRLNPVYSFNYQPGDNENRFNLHFKSSTGLVDGLNTGISVYSYDHTVVITNTTGLAGDVRIYDLAGRELLNANIGSSTTTRIPMQVALGTYVVKVITSSGTVNQKVFIH